MFRETPRLILRDYAETDVDALYAIQGDRDHMRYTHWAESREACAAFLGRYADSAEHVGFAPWTLVHRADERIVGWGGLNVDPNAPHWGPEVSYFLHPGYQGAGLATELVAASLAVGFEELELPAISAFTRPENRASARVLTKCGFSFVRYEPNFERNRYAIRLEEWIGRQGRG